MPIAITIQSNLLHIYSFAFTAAATGLTILAVEPKNFGYAMHCPC